MTPRRIQQLVRRELDKLQPLIKAVVHIKTASDMCDDLPEREADQDGHDAQIKTLHGVIKTARRASRRILAVPPVR
jgi:hypothetical protein